MYKLLPQTQLPSGMADTNIVQRLSDNAFIPCAIDNTDYQAYLKWLEEGNTPEPAED
jgi:hypothetical protein